MEIEWSVLTIAVASAKNVNTLYACVLYKVTMPGFED